MTHGIYRVVAFECTGAFRVKVRFDDGVEREIDLAPVMQGPMYGPLKDPALFRRAAIDPVAHTLVWPNGADFDPETLHDWPELADGMSALARRSAMAAAGVAEPRGRYDPKRHPRH
jgi:hypothetical protein